MLFLVDNRLLHLQQSVVDGDVKCAVLIERNPRIVGKMHANLPVVPTRRHYEVVLELTTVTVKGSVDARIQAGINHLCIVRDMDTPMRRIIPQEVIGRTPLRFGSAWNHRLGAAKLNVELQSSREI